MADIVQKMKTIAEPLAEELGFELVQVQFVKEGPDWYLRFLLDRPGGITVDDCERFSRRVESLIDADDPIPHRYTLEVSSAGLDRPLTREDDYRRFAGSLVEIGLYKPLEGRRRFSGRLSGLIRVADEALVELEIGGDLRVAVPLAAIARARLVPEFDRERR